MVAAEFLPQQVAVGFDGENDAVLAAGDGAEGVAVHAAALRGGRDDALGVVGGEAQAVGVEKGGEQGAVGPQEMVGHDGLRPQGTAVRVALGAGQGGAAGEDGESKPGGNPASHSETSGGGRAHGRNRRGAGYLRRVRSRTSKMPGVPRRIWIARWRTAWSGTAP